MKLLRLIAFLLLLSLLFPPEVLADGDLIAVYQEYNGVWYEFRYDTARPAQDFTSLDELKAFLIMDNTDSVTYLKADKSGVIRFNGQCEDSAIQLRDRAALVGRNIEVIPLDRYEYEKWYGSSIGTNIYHMIDMAIIGNEVYYIEPQNDKVWLALYLD